MIFFEGKIGQMQMMLKNTIYEVAVDQNLSNTGIFIHKFKMTWDLFLPVYIFDAESRSLIMLGSHEKFYRKLKRKK
jgi:hypothetical protein